MAIAEHCLTLHTLRARRLPELTDIGLRHLVRSCRDLRVLDLRDCEALTDRALREIAHWLPRLCIVAAEGAAQVTASGACELLVRCPALRVCSLNRCRVTEVAAAEAVRLRPCAVLQMQAPLGTSEMKMLPVDHRSL